MQMGRRELDTRVLRRVHIRKEFRITFIRILALDRIYRVLDAERWPPRLHSDAFKRARVSGAEDIAYDLVCSVYDHDESVRMGKGDVGHGIHEAGEIWVIVKSSAGFTGVTGEEADAREGRCVIWGCFAQGNGHCQGMYI